MHPTELIATLVEPRVYIDISGNFLSRPDRNLSDMHEQLVSVQTLRPAPQLSIGDRGFSAGLEGNRFVRPYEFVENLADGDIVTVVLAKNLTDLEPDDAFHRLM